jgi:hypothetical protein
MRLGKNPSFRVLVWTLCACSMAELAWGESEAPTYSAVNIYKHPWFWDVMVASAAGWFLGLLKGLSTTKEWFDKYWPTAAKVIIFLADLLVFICAGAYFGTGIYNPDKFVAAVAAGLSWPLALGALNTKGAPPRAPSIPPPAGDTVISEQLNVQELKA